MEVLDVIPRDIYRLDFGFVRDPIQLLHFPQLVFSEIYVLDIVEVLYSLKWWQKTVSYY